MDFITHLPMVHGKSVIWVIVDRLTKYGHFIALPSGYSAIHIAVIYMTEIYKLHGIPKSIVSDRDRVFISKFWKELFRLSGTQLAFSSAYHPQSDGQTEVTNHTLETYLRCYVTDTPRNWLQYLHLAEYWYNTTYHSAIQMTPFQALYGRLPPNLTIYSPGSTPIATLDETLSQRQAQLQLLKQNFTYAQQRMRSQANSHRVDLTFKVGDWVMLRLQPYRQHSVRNRQSPKFARRFYGPFKVLKMIGNVAYELQLPTTARIHPVFHVSKLKAFHGTPPATVPELGEEIVGTRVELRPAKLLGSRTLQTNHGFRRQVLIQWQDALENEATWEDKEEFQTSFPSFDLEDKVLPDRVGNDLYYALIKPIIYKGMYSVLGGL